MSQSFPLFSVAACLVNEVAFEEGIRRHRTAEVALSTGAQGGSRTQPALVREIERDTLIKLATSRTSVSLYGVGVGVSQLLEAKAG